MRDVKNTKSVKDCGERTHKTTKDCSGKSTKSTKNSK